jgi:uncharacterized protein YhjY with autotransporter beta-barrel domain
MKHLRYLCTLLACSASISATNAGVPYCIDDWTSAHNVSSSLNRSTLSAAWAGSRDVGAHLTRNQAGLRPGVSVPRAAAVPKSDAKASAKGPKVPIVAPKPRRWEVFGSMYFYSEKFDGNARYQYCHDKYCNKWLVGSTDTTMDLFGGSIGVEYRINSNWSTGVAVSASQADIDMGLAGSSDLDSISLIPYVSFYQEDAIGKADLWASGMYSYGMHDYDIRRNSIFGTTTGSPDGTTHLLEANIGLNYGEDNFVHGPYAGLRYITGEIDAYNEIGPAAAYVGQQDVDSLVALVGYQASWKIRGGNGVWVPQVRVAWEHDFEDGPNTFGLPGDLRDEDTAVVGASLSYWFDNGWNVGVGYEGRFGSAVTGHYGNVNAGKEF